MYLFLSKLEIWFHTYLLEMSGNTGGGGEVTYLASMPLDCVVIRVVVTVESTQTWGYRRTLTVSRTRTQTLALKTRTDLKEEQIIMYCRTTVLLYVVEYPTVYHTPMLCITTSHLTL